MMKADVVKFLAILQAADPNRKILPASVAMPVSTVDAWHALIGDLDAELALMALKHALQETKAAFIDPATIRKAAAVLSIPGLPTAGEAWEQVRCAMQYSGRYDIAGAKESCDPIVWRAAECVGFRSMCDSENQDTVRAQFRGAYESLLKREEQLRQVSPDVRQALDAVGVKQIEASPAKELKS